VRPDAEVEVPVAEVHGQITVEEGDLGWIFEPDLEDRALDARTQGDLAPVLLDQEIGEPLHRCLRGLEIGVFGYRPVRIVDDLAAGRLRFIHDDLP